ncbi:MAG: WYL domain-containing protein [Hydrococcus sp. RM1_1_31]|nr:WYL domain-containing protein [Hydrococcus sp. RM1_1_31]
MSRKSQSITLSISDRDKAALEALAEQFGMSWGENPNISKLVKAIANHKLLLAPNHDWSQERIKVLDIARKALIDLGKISEAREIAQITKERSELTIPFRAEIEHFLNNPQPAWRQQIDNFIHRNQPFRLSYRDAADRFWQYTVLHAQIIQIEKRLYLVCRTEELEGNQEVEGLRHNWSLLLERISEAAVVAIDKPWEDDLERLRVELHLRGGLAFAYQGKPDDLEISAIEGDPPTRRVARNIFSTFWFFREIAAYWEDCTIISPDSVRNKLREKVSLLYRQYESPL